MGASRRSFLAGGGAFVAGAWLPLGSAAPAAATAMPAEEDGYDLWLRYRRIADPALLASYRRSVTQVVADEQDVVLRSAADELVRGLEGLLDRSVPVARKPGGDGAVVVGTRDSRLLRPFFAGTRQRPGSEGFLIRSTRLHGRRCTVIAGESGRGALAGVFAFLRRIQLGERIDRLEVAERPAHRLRLLNHWDNLDRTVERGYAGRSIFHWDELPETTSRYTDYARALASIGLNGTVVNNVNANSQFLTSESIAGLAGLARALRAWGLRLYVSANFAAPIQIGGLATADPLDAAVRQWWREKAREIYGAIPDFGGFLVKADSEGQPGPLTYGRTHADGANMMAEAVEPFGGIVMWRTFVWDQADGDVAGDAYDAFAGLDGEFAPNVVLQTKFGPIDFQVREPFHPLFGALPNTNSMMEVQITQEYTGGTKTACYLVPIWKEALAADTHAKGPGSAVAKVIDGSLHGYEWSGMAGVANIGDERSWTGHQLSAVNTYGYGRLAWNPRLSAEQIAREWVRMTFGHDREVVETITSIVMSSRDVYEDYTSPLGVGKVGRGGGDMDRMYPDLVAREFYHRSDGEGTGFARTAAGGNGFTKQYRAPVARRFDSLDSCPEELLLFFHHVPYTHQLKRLAPGKTVIQHIYDTHFDGAESVRTQLRDPWLALRGKVDGRRFDEVRARLDEQVALSVTWRDAVVWYFYDKSGIPDEHDRLGIRVRPVKTAVSLVVGSATTVDLALTNATNRDVELTLELDSPAGWSGDVINVGLAKGETAEVQVVITAPAETVPGTVDLTFLLREPDGPQQRSTIPVITVPRGEGAALALDVGTATSPVLAGYQRLAGADMWDPARGYGWVGASPDERDRGAPDDLLRDFALSVQNRVLRVAVPFGAHRGFVLVGDNSSGAGTTIISIDGRAVAESGSLGRGMFRWLPFDLDGTDSGRTVDLQISGSGANWRFNALVLLRAS